jgi:cytochrome c556
MKAMKGVLLLAACLGIVAVAEEFPEFIQMMKVTGAASGALQKMEKKTGPQAVRAAERMGGVYEEMIGFWRQRNAAKAVTLSEEGKAAALELVNAANAGDADKAEAAYQRLTGTCKNCHAEYREKLADGKYQIKIK